jgi:hypothetical protein
MTMCVSRNTGEFRGHILQHQPIRFADLLFTTSGTAWCFNLICFNSGKPKRDHRKEQGMKGPTFNFTSTISTHTPTSPTEMYGIFEPTPYWEQNSKCFLSTYPLLIANQYQYQNAHHHLTDIERTPPYTYIHIYWQGWICCFPWSFMGTFKKDKDKILHPSDAKHI